MQARILVSIMVGTALAGARVGGDEGPPDPLGQLLRSRTFPKSITDEDWAAIAAVRKEPSSCVPRLVDELVAPQIPSRNAFHVVGFLPPAVQTQIMERVVERIPVAADHPELETLLTRLIPNDDLAPLKRVAQEIRAGGDTRAAHLAMALAEAARPRGTSLVASLAAESQAAWVGDPQFRKALRWATWRGVGVEISVPKTQFASHEEVIIGFAVENRGLEDIVAPLPTGWFLDSGGWINLVSNGNVLDRSARPAAKPVPTTLRSGERVSIYFEPNLEFVWRPHESPIERYTVRLANTLPIENVLALNEATFSVVPGSGEVYQSTRLTSDTDWVKAEVQISSPPSARRARVLQSALRSDAPDRSWKLLRTCDDAWAICETLNEIPTAMVQPDGLLRLVESPDLAVRRACLRVFARMEPSAEVAARLVDVVAEQRDATTRALGATAVRALKGR